MKVDCVFNTNEYLTFVRGRTELSCQNTGGSDLKLKMDREVRTRMYAYVHRLWLAGLAVAIFMFMSIAAFAYSHSLLH